MRTAEAPATATSGNRGLVLARQRLNQPLTSNSQPASTSAVARATTVDVDI